MVANPHDIHGYPYGFVEQDHHEGETHEQAVLHKLENIHVVLQAIQKSAENSAPVEIMNERFIQPLFKVTFGSNWIPNPRGKFYIYVMAPVATALNVTSPMGPPFVLIIPAPALPNMWNLLDLPEQSSIYLDTTATSNQMNIFVLLTDRKM